MHGIVPGYIKSDKKKNHDQKQLGSVLLIAVNKVVMHRLSSDINCLIPPQFIEMCMSVS